jgi:hypothetical protein
MKKLKRKKQNKNVSGLAHQKAVCRSNAVTRSHARELGASYILPPSQNVRRLRISQKTKFTNFDQIFRKNIYIYNIEWIHVNFLF